MQVLEKPLAIADNENNKAQPLFRKITEDGAAWLFIILADHGWSITRSGERLAGGSSGNASITYGVNKFQSLTMSTSQQVGDISQRLKRVIRHVTS
jgi:hypothetical protein